MLAGIMRSLTVVATGLASRGGSAGRELCVARRVCRPAFRHFIKRLQYGFEDLCFLRICIVVVEKIFIFTTAIMTGP